MAYPNVRYLFHDLLTDQFIEELPLQNVTVERKMAQAQPGNFTADLYLGDERVRRELNWRDATDGGGSVVYTLVNDVRWSCHVVWDTEDDLKTKVRKVTGAELWSYFHHRDITWDRQYAAGTDQLDVVRDLLYHELREPNANVRLLVDAVGTQPLSGQRVPLTLYTGDAGQDLAAAIEELAAVVNGFDFDIQISDDDAGNPVRRFVTGFPRLGSDSSPLVFSYPGNITEALTWPMAGSARINRAIALGQNKLRQDWTDAESLLDGYALMEGVTMHQNITDGAMLLQYAKADLAAQRWARPPQQPPVLSRPSTPSSWRRKAKPGSVPTLPIDVSRVDLIEVTQRLGDTVQVYIEDECFFPPPWLSPDGNDHRVFDQFRLIGVSLQPDKETASVMLNSLNGLDARLLAIS